MAKTRSVDEIRQLHEAMTKSVHRKLATDVWRMIKGMSEFADLGMNPDDDFDAAVIALIEMACDSAAESQRIALGHPPRGTR
jgi:hypothetical protein